MEGVKARKRRIKANEPVVCPKPDNRQVLPADEYREQIKKLKTSILVNKFRKKYKRGD